MHYNICLRKINFSAKFSYPSGFNGQERDDEIAGVGNFNTALYWEYDTRLGRRWNRDPKPDASVSEYATFGGNPIWISDPFGDTVQVSFRAGGLFGLRNNTVNYENGQLFNRDGSSYTGKISRFGQSTVDALNNLGLTTTGETALQELSESKNVFVIVQSNSGNRFDPNSVVQSKLAMTAQQGTQISGSGGTIYFNPYDLNGGLDTRGSTIRPAYIGLGHELLGHGLDANNGTSDLTQVQGEKFNRSENFATHMENQIRAEHGLPLRAYYGLRNGIGTYPLLNGGKSIYYNNFDYNGATKMKIINVSYVK